MFVILMWIYSILYTLAVFLYLPLFVYRMLFQDKQLRAVLKRFSGVPSPPSTSNHRSRCSVWIHAVSVGEVRAIKPLIDRLSVHPDHLFVSTITETGQAQAQALLGNSARVFYFPLDWQWLCRRHLRALRPCVVLLTETEIWPAFITAAAAQGVPVVLVNGRISDSSFRGYQRFGFFLRPLLQQISHFCMQSKQDKQRILALGVPSSRVNQVGNLKYDYNPPASPEKQEMVERVRVLITPDEQDLLWVCGSTRDGEEPILLDVFQSLRCDFPSLRLILAPRHPHRAPILCRLLEDRELQYTRLSQLGEADSSEVLLLDTIGDLPYLYQLADVVFVGGSLVPTGGHNIIETAYFGKPIIFGPHMENFREISGAFLESYAAVQVQSGEELIPRIRDLFQDPAARFWLGRNARRVIRDNRGSVSRTLELVQPYVARDTGDRKAVDLPCFP